MQVFNIIAELKTENSVEIIEFLKSYGFLCMKYREEYGGVLPSDVPFNISKSRRLTVQHPLAADEEYVHDHPYVAEEVWGVPCDEARQSPLKDVEVCVLCSSSFCAFIVTTCRITGSYSRRPWTAFGAMGIVSDSKHNFCFTDEKAALNQFIC